MSKEYEMTTEDLDVLLKASKPVPYIIVGGVPPRGPQENANDAWKALADKMGFIWDTVEPILGKDAHFFTAIPKEPADHDDVALL